MRFAVAVGISKHFETMLNALEDRLKLSRPQAVGTMLFLSCVCFGTTIGTLGIGLASALSGVPVWVR